MALSGSTFWYGSGPGQSLENVLEGFASASNSSQLVELYINQGAASVTDAGAPGGATSRQINKNEVLLCLELLKEQIVRDTSGKFD